MPVVALPARSVCPAGTAYLPSGAPLLEAGEDIALALTGVSMVVGTIDCGNGALYLTTDRLIWVCEAADRPGATVEYEGILMHAVSRDGSADATGRPALFCHMEADPAWESSLETASTVVSGVAKAAAIAASGDVPDEDLAAAIAGVPVVEAMPMDADAGHPAVVSVLFVPGATAAVLLETMPAALAEVALSGESGMFLDVEADAVAPSAAAALGSGVAPVEDALSKMFRFLSLCAAAHPGDAEADEAGDAVTGSAEDDAFAVMGAGVDPSGWITGADGLSEAQAAALDSLHAKMETSKFADAMADEDEDEDVDTG